LQESSVQDASIIATPTKEAKIDPARYKTKLCKHWMETGMCPFQGRCIFSHGQEEIRTADENRAKGLTTESALREVQNRASAAVPNQTVKYSYDKGMSYFSFVPPPYNPPYYCPPTSDLPFNRPVNSTARLNPEATPYQGAQKQPLRNTPLGTLGDHVEDPTGLPPSEYFLPLGIY